MYNHILVSVDGSPTSSLALDEALRLAKELQSQVRIVHVVDSTILYQGNMDFVDIGELEKALNETGQQILKSAVAIAENAGINAESKLLKNEQFLKRIPDIIVDEACDWPADLVVVGTHGRRGFSHLFLGSVAEGVVRISQMPVLLIRGHSPQPYEGAD